MKLNMLRFAVLMAAAESLGGGGSAAAAAPNPDEAANAAAAAAAAPDPAAASLATAREWVDSGVSVERAAEWLAANVPDAYKDAEAAKAAISQ